MIILKVKVENLLYGGDGNDTFIATSFDDGADQIDGGAGSDTLDYSVYATTNYITVSLGESNVIVDVVVAGSGNTDKVQNIENIIATQGADVITGNTSSNTLIGMKGKDQFIRWRWR